MTEGKSQKEALVRELLEAAVRLAEEAGAVTLEHFGSTVDAETKADGTPVTAADRAAESHLRNAILELYPDHGILGEEFGETRPGARVRWILDPIDGTKSYMHGVPLYGVLIGIEIDDEPVVGVSHFPALEETVSAGKGLGCWHDGRKATVSDTVSLEDSLALTTDVERTARCGVGDGWRRIAEGARFARTWGDCYGHCLVATGRAEIMVDPELSPWDAAPLLTIVTEAGGVFTDLEGRPTTRGGSGISTNGRLHRQVLRLLRPPPSSDR